MKQTHPVFVVFSETQKMVHSSFKIQDIKARTRAVVCYELSLFVLFSAAVYCMSLIARKLSGVPKRTDLHYHPHPS